MKTVKATKTTKVFESTIRDLKRLVKDDKEGATQAQIISRALWMYADNNGYVYTASGLVGVGDKVIVDGDELEVKIITKDNIIFTDFSEITKGSGIAWRMQRIAND